MRVALVDDDELQLNTLTNLVDNELSSVGDTAHNITTYHSAEDFLNSWECGLYDLVILDIYMGEMTGIELAYKIRETDHGVLLAFCTSSNEFASESFDVGARHYLRKPITEDGIHKMFSRLNLEEIEKNRTVTLPDGHTVKLRNILYTEYTNHVVTIYIKYEKPHRFRISHTELENQLIPHGYFFAPCKGIIINFYEAISFDEKDGSFVMSNGEVIPVVRRKHKDAKDAYTKFLFQKMSKEVAG